MKSRIKIDSTLLAVFIIFTLFLFRYPACYPQNIGIDNTLDFVGLIVVVFGNFLRMAARGHKKAHSQQGHGLVMSGPYTLVRNPMYLGSFLMGCGFVLIVWPWWSLPIFAALFYLRFRRQVVKEEKYLTELFGDQYENYERMVPRTCPRWRNLVRLNLKENFPLQEIWSTKERRGLLTWPLLAIVLEILQQRIIYHHVTIVNTLVIFFIAELTALAIIGLMYMKTKKIHG